MQKRSNEIHLLKGRNGLYRFKYSIKDNSGTNTPVSTINNVWVDKGMATDKDQISTLEDQIEKIPQALVKLAFKLLNHKEKARIF